MEWQQNAQVIKVENKLFGIGITIEHGVTHTRNLQDLTQKEFVDHFFNNELLFSLLATHWESFASRFYQIPSSSIDEIKYSLVPSTEKFAQLLRKLRESTQPISIFEFTQALRVTAKIAYPSSTKQRFESKVQEKRNGLSKKASNYSLLSSVLRGDLDAMKDHLKKGCDVNKRFVVPRTNYDGFVPVKASALAIALELGDQDIVELLHQNRGSCIYEDKVPDGFEEEKYDTCIGVPDYGGSSFFFRASAVTGWFGETMLNEHYTPLKCLLLRFRIDSKHCSKTL